MEIDIDQIKSDLADVSIDASYIKDLSKHLEKIERNLNIIDNYLIDFVDNPQSQMAQDLMQAGYWFYKFRDYHLKYQKNR